VAGGQANVIAGGGVKVYVTWTAPEDVATVPCVTTEVMFTLKAAANAAAEIPEAAVALPVGTAPDDCPPVIVSVVLGGAHVTPAGPVGVKVT